MRKTFVEENLPENKLLEVKSTKSAFSSRYSSVHWTATFPPTHTQQRQMTFIDSFNQYLEQEYSSQVDVVTAPVYTKQLNISITHLIQMTLQAALR